MSEKKTAEIKLRIEPSVKAQWQQSAADEGIGLSEFIAKAVSGYRGPFSVQYITTNDVLALPVGTPCANGSAAAGDVIRHIPTGETFTATPVPVDSFTDGFLHGFADARNPVPTSEGEKKFGATWKPWEA